MSSIPYPNIAALGGEIAAAPEQGIAEAARIRALNTQTAGQALQNQIQQQQLKDQQAMTAAMHDWDGQDMNALPALVVKHGASANAVMGLKKTLLDYQTAQANKTRTDLENENAVHDQVTGALAPGLDPKQVSDVDLPNWIRSTTQTLLQQGKIDPQHAQTAEALAGLPPDQARQQLDIVRKGYMSQTALNNDLAKKAEVAQNTAKAGLDAAQAEAANYKEDPNLGLIDIRTKQPISNAASAPLSAQEAAILGKNEGDQVPLKLKNTANEIVNRGIRNVQAGGRSLLVDNQGNTIKDMGAATPVVVNNLANNTGVGGTAQQIAQQFGMTPVAFDQQAEKYYTTGQLPQIGRGGNGLALQRALMNRAAELHPEASLAGNQAAFKANEASLNGLVKQRDSVSAFESTAIKNLDQFMGTAKSVIDSGSPLINLPLRAAAGRVAGSTNQAAFDAARQVALTEIAKVVNNPGLSGQLSDSGRQEVMALNPATATLGQIYRVAGILKQDMANRHQSYNEQIADIQKRIGTASTTEPTSTPNGGDFFSNFGGKKRQGP